MNGKRIPNRIEDEPYFAETNWSTDNFFEVEVNKTQSIKYLRSCRGILGLQLYNKDHEPIDSRDMWLPPEYVGCGSKDNYWSDEFEIPEGQGIIGLELAYVRVERVSPDGDTSIYYRFS